MRGTKVLKWILRHWIDVLLAVALLVGVGILAYPSVSDWVNQRHASYAISNYNGAVETVSAEQLESIRESAQAYNARLAVSYTSFNLDDAEMAEYNSELVIPNTAVMATIEIPSIDVSLPIFHGAEDDVLQVGAGHLPGSSLPGGGASTHCVLMGHRGLPSARLFTDLDKLVVGDVFCVTTLGKKAWYEVDQILIVEPDDTSALGIVSGEDLCTLVTCTPYGINSHRLLVRGHRVDDPDSSVLVTSDAYVTDPLIVASVMAIPGLVIVVAVLVVVTRRRKRQEQAAAAGVAGGAGAGAGGGVGEVACDGAVVDEAATAGEGEREATTGECEGEAAREGP